MKTIITLDLDKPRNLRLGYKAQLEIEEIIGIPFLVIDFGKLKLEEITKVLFCCIEEKEADLNYEKLIDIVDKNSGSIEIMNAITRLVTETFELNGDAERKKN